MIVKSGGYAYASAEVESISDKPYSFMLVLCEKENGKLNSTAIDRTTNLKSGTQRLETDKIKLSENSEVYALLWDDVMRSYNVKFNVN